MHLRTKASVAAALALLLAGCSARSGQATQDKSDGAGTSAVITKSESDSVPTTANSMGPAADPLAGASNQQAASPSAAAAVVQDYYAAIERGDFPAAFAFWGNDGADSHQSFADFKRGFAETAKTSVKTGKPTNSEGAAGSIYIDVPVTVRATLKDGKHQRFTGHYTLRRVNDVPGSTAEQRRWHLSSAELKEE